MKVHLRMVGCRLNQSEIDSMARGFQAQGHEIVDSPNDADHLILNTCAVTNEAAKTSRKLIRDFHRGNPQAQTTVTGCYAEIAPDELRALPGVQRVVGNRDKDRLVSIITGESITIYDSEPLERDPRPGPSSRTRAFVKVQDGCDNSCTFCVTTIARGHGRSRPMHAVLREVNHLHQLGFQETVLTGVHLGSYGHDLGQENGLAQLVNTLLKHSDIPRLRLSSLEPWDLAPDFFALWDNSRLCRHLHLPLQSGCDATLKRMRRNTNQAAFRELMQSARKTIPMARITTDVIVGFPGESAREYQTSEAFIREMRFDGLHVFRYSSRPGTPASRMQHHISATTKKQRSERMLKLSAQMESQFAAQLRDSTQNVLWEQIIGASPDGFLHAGYSGNYMRVKAVHPDDLRGHITPVRLGAYTDGAIHGTVMKQ